MLCVCNKMFFYVVEHICNKIQSFCMNSSKMNVYFCIQSQMNRAGGCFREFSQDAWMGGKQRRR